MAADRTAHVDERYLVDTLSRLARVPTDVPLGFNTLMEPDDPKLVHYVQDVVRPELAAIGVYDLLDVPRNNLVARLGAGRSGRALLIQNYTPAQHHNLMDEPFSGKVANAAAYGCPEPAVFGQGVSQNKAHQAVMLAVLKTLVESGAPLDGTLYWAVNNEGRSSHECSEAIIASLDPKPSFGIIQIGTGLKISLGNRGRVDVNVHVKGRAAHSSTPSEGLSAIDAANEVVNRLRRLKWADRHPILGGRHAIVYKMRFEPVAPHTLPAEAFLTVDRRLLPGDDPEIATDEVRRAIGDMAPYEVAVETGVLMWPALVDPKLDWVAALAAAHLGVTGSHAETVYGQGTFDAGGPCRLGVPTVMYGATGGVWPTGADFVPISAAVAEADVLAGLIRSQLA
ncbi:MAG TPA: peptidase dimerization domain-containing protein [bacterium]|nr:peptidase dimerization domain-containing protein [bacterium]